MFEGYNKRYKHYSPTLGCSMTIHIYFPPPPPTASSPDSHKFPISKVLYWFSGLTSKSGAQRAASSEGIALVAPDTSTRGLNVEGEADSWDFGLVSAFAPIVNPINCPWGKKAFTNYLGENKTDWEDYDDTCLISKFKDASSTILIHQGLDDKFLHDQLLANNFEEACRKLGQSSSSVAVVAWL